MKILFTGINHSTALSNANPISFTSVASQLGFERVFSLSEIPDIVVCIDFRRKDLSVIRSAKKLNIPVVLILAEPSVVIPEHANESILGEFDRLLQVGRASNSALVPWPQSWRDVQTDLNRLSAPVLINADKWSFIKGNNYWLRSAIIQDSPILDLYGPGWSRPQFIRLAHRIYDLLRAVKSRTKITFRGIEFLLIRPRNYRGEASDKIDVMSKYKVALVIENSNEYLSEKLFDAWFAGCIPVYVGPDTSKFGLSDSLVVKSGATVSELQGAIKTAMEMNHEVFLKNLEKFITSESAQKWRSELILRETLLRATAEVRVD